MTPILCFTTAEAWEHLHDLGQEAPLERSIFFADFASVDDIEKNASFDERWDKLLTLRGAITRVLEWGAAGQGDRPFPGCGSGAESERRMGRFSCRQLGSVA